MSKNYVLPLNKAIGIISVILLMVLFVFNVTNIRSDLVVQIMIYWSFAAIAAVSVLSRKRMSMHTAQLIGFVLYAILITVMVQSMSVSTLAINFGYMTLWACVIIAFTCANENQGFDQTLIHILTIFAIVIGIYLMFNYSVHKANKDWGYVNNNYYLLCSIPLIMICKAKVLKRIALIIATLTVLLSFKRTGILSLIAMGIFILIYNFRKKPNFIIRTTFVLLVFVILALNYDTISQMLGVDVFYRFDSISEDNAVGRGRLYQIWFEIISNSNFLTLLLGSGYNGMINVHHVQYSAHNDFMELMIDYGIVGIVLYVGIIWRYIKICIYNIKHATQYAEACIASICAFVFLSLFSHCVIYPSYFMLILIFWIYVEAKTKMQISKDTKETTK